MSLTDTLTVSAPCPDLDQDESTVILDRGLDPVIASARAAGRRVGEHLARTPLTPRQRAAVASVMGGGAR